MGAMPGGAYGFLAVSIVVFVMLGSVLEGIPAIVLFGPLLFPIARQAGVHEVHYAMVVIFAMGIGLFSPPFGVGYYGAARSARYRPTRASSRSGAISPRCSSAWSSSRPCPGCRSAFSNSEP